MGCFIVLIAVFMPRVALVLMWIFTNYVSRAFSSWIWPFIGLIFLPITTMIYSLAYVPGIGVTGLRWLWVALGVVLDIMWHSSGGWRYKSSRYE